MSHAIKESENYPAQITENVDNSPTKPPGGLKSLLTLLDQPRNAALSRERSKVSQP
jgi:hypothetical protein